MTFLEAQLLAVQAQVLYRHAEVVSGAYKLRKTQRGQPQLPAELSNGDPISWRELTDEEKLADSMKILQVQARRMNELAEAIYDQNNPEKQTDDEDD